MEANEARQIFERLARMEEKQDNTLLAVEEIKKLQSKCPIGKVYTKVELHDQTIKTLRSVTWFGFTTAIGSMIMWIGILIKGVIR